MKDIQSQVLQDALKRLDKTYKNFFRGNGFPKYRSRRNWHSFTFPQIAKFPIEGKRIKLPKIGFVKGWFHRPIKGKIKTITVKQEGNHWFACISSEIDHTPPNREKQAIGIDLGVTRLATLSSGEYFEPFRADALERKRRIKQRKLSRQKKFGQNWKKTVKQLTDIQRKIARKRKDNLHKASHSITQRFTHIALENLNLSNMTASAKGTMEEPGTNVKQKAGLNRSFLNQGLSAFGEMLTYKARENGGELVKINPVYTSQACAKCGHTEKANRKTQAKFACQSCGYEANADHNAAKNILSSGLELLPLTQAIRSYVGKEAHRL